MTEIDEQTNRVETMSIQSIEEKDLKVLVIFSEELSDLVFNVSLSRFFVFTILGLQVLLLRVAHRGDSIVMDLEQEVDATMEGALRLIGHVHVSIRA